MTLQINYQKRKNANLFNKFQTNKTINLANIQNYIPIYDRFFSLNNTNWNSINLNHRWNITDVISLNKTNTDNGFSCKLKNIDENAEVKKNVFIKMAPLLDPFKYFVGKYDYKDISLFNLPSYDKTIKVNPKISDPNNSAFIDGFFSYLTSKTFNDYKFIHGLDYYGSFLAIKNDYKINIIDDLEYLLQSDFFVKNQNTLFKVEDYSHLITNNKPAPLKPLKISNSEKSLEPNILDENMFEDVFETNTSNNCITLNDVKNMGVDLIDITNSPDFVLSSAHKTTDTLKSGSTCSSRTSYTDDDDDDDEDDEDDEDDDDDDNNNDNANNNNNANNDVNEDDDEWEDEDDSDASSLCEETLMLTVPKFPVQVICMEQCENTFDSLIMNGKLTDDEWFSALMQIIMTLLTYQKMFSFTHNDLHSNNIMYVSTNKKYLYYIYKKQIYKVPTFGKIYKIIDFGRAIYRLNGKIFCSDSFQTGGDAATQYNTEPYFNDKKPRLEPNYSFDLCRLACSIFDYVVDDFEMVKNVNECSLLVKLIVDWCIDDNGINVLYKNNGVERYPDFKLYKMIARYVHKHTPANQLERDEFKKYIVHKPEFDNGIIINVDDMPMLS